MVRRLTVITFTDIVGFTVLEHLGRAIERRVGTVVLLGAFSAIAPARSDPRFQALLDRIGIPPAVAA